ncbi:ATP synthase F1 subunit gamma [bacterium]|nr:ATP synthase F1 subunit gamma [bacterium]
MSDIRTVKQRIKGIRNIQQITRAMKMVAAVKFRKNQERLLKYRPFGESHRQMIGRILARSESIEHPLLQENARGNPLVIIITSDKGLCGGFNQQIIREAETTISGLGHDKTYIYAIGRKGRDYFRKRGYNIWKYLRNDTDKDFYQKALDLGTEIISAYLSGTFDKVTVVYSLFVSGMVQKPSRNELIPVPKLSFYEEFPREYAFEPSAQEILGVLLPLGIKLTIYRCLIETAAAEQGARMTAMEAATDNAGDMIASLSLVYNKARQAAITKEIIEIVSGADALQ